MTKEQNLIPFANRTESEQRKIRSKGGKKSGESRREKANLRKLLEVLLETKHGDMTTAQAITMAIAEKALSGDVRAYEVIRDTLGQKPTDKMALSGTDGGPIQNSFTVTFVDPSEAGK